MTALRRVVPRVLVFILGAPGLLLAQTDHPAGIANWSSPATWTAPAHRGSHALAIESDIGGPLPFVPVTPCRIVDTRNAAGPYGGPSIAPGAPRNFALASGPCAGIPSTAGAYSLNITATNTTGTGFVKVYPQGGVSPVVSTLNFVAGETIANAAVVPAGTGGGITVAAAAQTDVIIDINGYYVSTLNGGEQLLITANAGGGAIRGVNGSGDGVQGQTSNAGSSGVFGTNTANGKGVFGTSGSGSGVEGQSTSGPGLRGNSSTGSGVYGRTAGSSGASGAAGVWGDTHDYFGVWGTSVNNDGVHGQSTNASGVYGLSAKAGVWGDSTGFDGVHGHTTAGTASGVAGFNDSNGAGTFGSSAQGDGAFGSGLTGVHGTSQFGWGVYGHSATQDGVHGDTPSNSASAVAGINTANGYGVFGSTNQGDGVFGQAIGAFNGGNGVHAFGTKICTGDLGGCYVGTWSLFVEGAALFNNFLGVQGDLFVVGDKHFVTPHPVDPTKQIAFVSLEGPESGTYFRGSGHLVGGYAEIPVPESFRLVTSEHGLTAVATPSGSAASIFCVSKSLDRIVFQGSADVDFDYVVNGVRAGYENYQPIEKNFLFVPRSASDKALARMPAEAARRLKANGILNEDGSVNEETARRLGWDQKPGWNAKPAPTPTDLQ